MENLISKKMPSDEKIEQIVLGSLMLEADALDSGVMSILSEKTFYNDKNKAVFNAIYSLYKTNRTVDICTIVEQLSKDGNLEKVGGAYYVASLVEGIGCTSHVEYHSKILVQKQIRREIIEATYDAHEAAYDPQCDLPEIVSKLNKLTDWVSNGIVQQSGMTIKEILPDVVKTIENSSADGISGVPTGFQSMDKIVQGWQPSDMIVIAARPSMGKTAFSLSMAVNIASMNIPVAFFSLEMSAKQIVQRVLSMETGINASQIRSGQLSSDEWQHLDAFLKPISDLPLIIDDQSSLKTLDFRTKAKKYVERYGCKIIIIDYLQLMKSSEKTQNREREVALISSIIKEVAKELNVPVLALSQLNRAVEGRQGNKRPTLSDLRDSGSIEQDADLVCFIHRPEKYGIEVTEDGEPTEGLGQIIIAKHRNGEVCDVNLHFIANQAKFVEW